MNPIVSVIIPNYNEAKYIKRCINSVLNQTYQNIEIIIVDDGSTDGSLDILEDLSEKTKIRLFTQERQNAAIARNVGIANANGEYCYFLDADDIVYEDSIEKMVSLAEKYNSDFVIGNMSEIDEDDNVTNTIRMFEKDEMIYDYRPLLGLSPNPSNKLYKKSVIRNNNISFGNVRIGQDLNFYIKYLACCKSIYTTSDVIYAWRDVPSSMSRKVSFNIFDIVNSFDDIRKFYEKKALLLDYNDYIRTIEVKNYYSQMDKQQFFCKLSERLLVVNYFKIAIKKLGNVKKCNNYGEFSMLIRNGRIKSLFKWIYVSKLYTLIK